MLWKVTFSDGKSVTVEAENETAAGIEAAAETFRKPYNVAEVVEAVDA